MNRRNKKRQRVTAPKRRPGPLVTVAEVTPENMDEIIERFFSGPGIYGVFDGDE